MAAAGSHSPNPSKLGYEMNKAAFSYSHISWSTKLACDLLLEFNINFYYTIL